MPPGGPPPAPGAYEHPQPNPYAGRQHQGGYGGAPYPGPYGGPRQAPASRTMAGWALGLSMAFCAPLLPAVGLILGIVVLARSRDGRDHGKGMAIGAVVVGGLVTVVQVVSIAAGVVEGIREGFDGTTRDESGNVVDSGEMIPTKLRVGDCFDDPNLRGLSAEGVESGVITGIPCDEPHDAEVYGIFQMSGGDYPGQAAIDEHALKCLPAFKEFVGRPYAKSNLEVGTYMPSSRSWRLMGDRAVTCVAWDPEQERLTGSLENARR